MRRIDDRRRQHRAEHAAVGDGERAAGELLDGELAFLRALAEIGDLLLDLGDRHLVGVAQDRHHEAARAAHRDADVEVAVIDDVVAVDRRVDDRIFLERMHRRLDEEAHEAELDAVLLLEALLVAVAQLDHRRHVHFVERGEDRGGRLRLHEPLGDALAQARHRHALLGPRAERRRRACSRRRVRRQPARRRRSARQAVGAARARPARLRRRACRPRRREHVALGDAAAAAGARDTSAGRCPARPSSCAPRAAPCAAGASGRLLAPRLTPAPARPPARVPRRGCAAALRRGCRRRRQRRRALASVSITAMTSCAVTVAPSALRISVSTPAAGAGSSSTTLSVSMSIRFSSRLTASPGLLVPVDERRLGDGLRQHRHFDFDCSCSTCRVTCARLCCVSAPQRASIARVRKLRRANASLDQLLLLRQRASPRSPPRARRRSAGPRRRAPVLSAMSARR